MRTSYSEIEDLPPQKLRTELQPSFNSSFSNSEQKEKEISSSENNSTKPQQQAVNHEQRSYTSPKRTHTEITTHNDSIKNQVAQRLLARESNPELGAVEAAAQPLSDFTEVSEDRLALDPLYVLDCLTRYYNEKGYQFQDADALEELVSFFIEDMNALQFEAAMRGVKKNGIATKSP